MNDEEESSESPVITPFEPLYQNILAKIYNGKADKLDQDLAKEQEAGGTKLFALRRLTQKMRTRTVSEDKTVTGLNLQTYKRLSREGQEERGYSTYVATENGVVTIHFDNRTDIPNPKDVGVSLNQFGLPISWTHLREDNDLLSGNTFLRVNPGKSKFGPAKESEISKTLWQMAKPLNPANIEDGLGLWRGYIANFSQVKRFGTDEKLGIVGTGGVAHLNVIATETPPPPTGRSDGGIFLELTEETQLRSLFGDLYDANELMSETGLSTARGNLKGTPIVIFGRGKTPEQHAKQSPNLNPMKQAKISFSYGLGRIVPFGETE